MNSSTSVEAREAVAAQHPTPAISGTALAVAGLAGAALLSAARPALAVSPALTFNDIPGTGLIKVLNYALALEDLETELYFQAEQRLTTGGTGGGAAALGTSITGLGFTTAQRDVKFTSEFRKVETEHRDFLRAAIAAAGGPVISPFRYNFNMPNLNRQQVINLLYTAEKTGVTAYLGAIPFFPGINNQTRPYLRIAAAIQGTEARHTAIFADLLNDLFSVNVEVAPLSKQNGGRDLAVTPDAVLAAVSPFIVVPVAG